MKDKEVNPVMGMAEETMKTYEQACRTGMKFQEEMGQRWNSTLEKQGITQDWQKRLWQYTSMTDFILPATQKRAQEVLELMDKNSQIAADLMKKAADAVQSSAFGDCQNKWMDFWKTSTGAARTNIESLLQIQSRAMDSWMEFCKKSTDSQASTKNA